METKIYTTLLILHSGLRWVVLLAALYVIVKCILGLKKNAAFEPQGRTAALIYVSALDLQFLIGIILYAISPIIRAAWSSISSGSVVAVMKNQEMRFFVVEHVITMVVAVALAHVGSVLAKKATTDLAKYRRLLIFSSLSFVVLLLGIPWWRPLLRF